MCANCSFNYSALKNSPLLTVKWEGKVQREQTVSLLKLIYFPVEMSYSSLFWFIFFLLLSLCTCSMCKSTAVFLFYTSSWQLSIIDIQTGVEIKIVLIYLLACFIYTTLLLFWIRIWMYKHFDGFEFQKFTQRNSWHNNYMNAIFLSVCTLKHKPICFA